MFLLRPIRRQEQQARQDFLQARQEAAGLEAGVGLCVEALALQDAWAREALRAGGPVDLSAYRQRTSDLNGELSARRAALGEAKRKLQGRRQELVHWMKQRKAFEQLLRRRQAQAAAEAARKDTRELDHVHAAQAAWRAGDEDGWDQQG
jgi:hypothetical protein